MSGSSLDGLDAAVVSFRESDSWTYEIEKTLTIELPAELKCRLSKSHQLGEDELSLLDQDFGTWIAQETEDIAKDISLVGVHGHTVRHSPKDGMSLQIGHPQVIADVLKKPTVAHFRNRDIQLGGQGAPLVPMGEKHLFKEFDGFLNLGGICNASFKKHTGEFIAGDIGGFNQVFNYYAQKLNKPFDEDGEIARNGHLNSALIEKWNQLPYFQEAFPKSLGNDWVRRHFLMEVLPPENMLHTFADFISSRIADQINRHKPKRTLVTGGGTHNSYLMELIQGKTETHVIVPNRETVDFKEAIVFAFLALLRNLNRQNVLSSCTGASSDSSSGEIFLPD